MTILSWYENRSEDEVPPEHLWEDPEGLNLWWERVSERSGIRSSGGASPDGAVEEMVGNDLAPEFKR